MVVLYVVPSGVAGIRDVVFRDEDSHSILGQKVVESKFFSLEILWSRNFIESSQMGSSAFIESYCRVILSSQIITRIESTRYNRV